MSEENNVQPFQLYEKANLRKVIESYSDNLEWSVIQVEPAEPFAVADFLKRSREGAVYYTVKTILLPQKHGRIFMAYARDISSDFEKRLNSLLREKSMLKDQKLNILQFCYRLVLEAEQKYDSNNLFTFALDFQWKIRGQEGRFHPTTYESLVFDDVANQLLFEEFTIRSKFFQWLRLRLDRAINQLQQVEFHDPLLRWKVDAPKMKVVEIMYALRSAKKIEFTDSQAQTLFENYLEKIFSLGKTDWRDLESEIRNREDKRHNTKFHFLKSISETHT